MSDPQAPQTAAQRPIPTEARPVDFGPNVLIFEPGMNMASISSRLDPISWSQDGDFGEFGPGRFAYFFKKGSYNLNVNVSYYITVHGLGPSPDDVKINGTVQSLATRSKGMALNSFWRGVENLALYPPGDDDDSRINVWAVSQATFFRRVHVNGRLFLWDYRYDTPGGNFSSGGFVADCVIKNDIASGSQQQFLTRNTKMKQWMGGNWNMVFVGDDVPNGSIKLDNNSPPEIKWPDKPFTVVPQTPVIREKPYLIFDNGDYAVQVPGLISNAKGASWPNPTVKASTIPISQFYIAKAETDNAETLNDALSEGYHLILTPGIYHLTKGLHIRYADTVILGLGMATLIPVNGTSAITIEDVDGVSICGILFDAGPCQIAPLLVAGPVGSTANHSRNPTALFDLSSRIGGAAVGSTQNCFTINSNDVIIDNIWLWRADHGKKDTVGWNVNPADNGLTVNGNRVKAYGLFVEHFQGYQTLWNGEEGEVYFYQSEIPYDVPDQWSWARPFSGLKGFPAYKVSDGVKQHTAQGLGVYCNFDNPVQLDNAIETPVGDKIKMNHMVTRFLSGAPGSSINYVINGTPQDGGRRVDATQQLVRSPS